MRYWKIVALAGLGMLSSACGPDMPSRNFGGVTLVIGGIAMLVLAAEQINYRRDLRR